MSYEARREQLQLKIREAGWDGLLVSATHHVSYLTGFTGDSSYLLLLRDRAILASDTRFTMQIQEECPNLETAIRGHDRTTAQLLAEVVEKTGIRHLGFEAGNLTVAALERLSELMPAVTFVPTTGLVETLRAIKDASEIATFRRAIRIAETAFADFRKLMQRDDTERELVNRLEFALRRAGAETSAFPIIIGIGERSALPHCPPTAKKLSEADFLLVDWGALVDGYHSDLTRVIRSPFADLNRFAAIETRVRDLYNNVLAAQAAGASVMRAGVAGKTVDAAVRSRLKDCGLEEYFTHGLGHGLGREVHEAPSIRGNMDDVLEAGMVVTLEPGVYLPGFAGVRIEDDYLITEDGAERLSTLPQDWAFFEC